MSVKLLLDLVMALFFIASLGFRNTGDAAHEFIGFFFCVLCIVHGAINWHWYKNIMKGRYTFRRTINTVLNILLPIAFVLIFLSGSMNSRHIFGFLNLKGSMEIRQIHSLVAYWGIVLLGVHAGTQWGLVVGVLNRSAGISRNWPLMRGVAFLIAAYGIWASFDRDMWSKLFLGFSFDFWDSSRPEFLFYTNNLAIMALYTVVAHYAVKEIMKLLRTGIKHNHSKNNMENK